MKDEPSPPSPAASAVRAPVHIEQKGWGHEVWIHNDERYCGKILVVKEGKRCSLHYHKLKYETFYIQSGKIHMRLRPQDGEEREFIMNPGDVLELSQGTAHQFTGLEDSEIMEFSTQHFEEDSYRLEKGD
jgi:mannose-6-phosphate isomerase-like protein (cupin superfamily)